jgi:flagellar basal-body rod modification protein FlgD
VPDARADALVLAVSDAQGRLVARESVPLGAESYVWQGLDATGAPLPAGTYSLSLENLSGEEVVSTAPVESWQRIEEVRRGPDGPVLVLPGGVTVSADEASALRIGGV